MRRRRGEAQGCRGAREKGRRRRERADVPCFLLLLRLLLLASVADQDVPRVQIRVLSFFWKEKKREWERKKTRVRKMIERKRTENEVEKIRIGTSVAPLSLSALTTKLSRSSICR